MDVPSSPSSNGNGAATSVSSMGVIGQAPIIAAHRASRIPIRSPARQSHTANGANGTNGGNSAVTSSSSSSSGVAAATTSGRVSSAGVRRATLPSSIKVAATATPTTTNGSDTITVVAPTKTVERVNGATKRSTLTSTTRRTLPSSLPTSSSANDSSSNNNGNAKRLTTRNSSTGSTASSSTMSAAAIIRAKKAAAITGATATATATAATTSSSSSNGAARTLGTVMGGGRHVDPAQRRARKAAAAAAAAKNTDGEDGDGEKATKSKVVRGELYYPYGRCRYALTAGDSLGSIRAALNKHGWKELKDPNAVTWDLFWSISSRALQPAKMKPSQICNHFQANGCITTKIGLCRNTRKVSGHVDTFFPRCFVISEPKEMELFEKQYQIQAAAAVLLRYLSLADATLHSKDPSVAAAAVPALMTPTVVWLAMLAIRGHCRKLATALAADANWSPLQAIHPRDANVAASIGAYSFAAPSDDGTMSNGSSTSVTAGPGATHKRRSELDRAEWKAVVKCAESFSGISKLPLVARSKADMESLPAADPNAPPRDANDDDEDDSGADEGHSDGNGDNTATPTTVTTPSSPSVVSNQESKETKTSSSTNGVKAKRASMSAKDGSSNGVGSGASKSKDGSKPSSTSSSPKKTSKTIAAGSGAAAATAVKQRRTAAAGATTKSRDPVWEQNIAARLFSSRTINEALTVAAELRRVDPQFMFNGEHNVWILKPGGKSRGRGIQCFDTLLSITKYMKKDHKDKWVAQKYMERPLTVYKKKFDIRQWVFVTQFGSCLRLWFYNDCYVRFSSQDFDLTDLSPAIHLTNNSIQGKLADFDTLDFDAKGNMWSSQRFEEFLEANYSTRPIHTDGSDSKEEKATKPNKTVWMERLRPQMKQIARYAIECGYGRMKYRSHTFELFGLDYMLDENLTPWLLEVNSSPTLCHIAVEGIVERMTYDLFCVLFAEHQRYMDDEGGRDKVGAVVTPPSVMERKHSLPTPPTDGITDANGIPLSTPTVNGTAAATVAPPPSSTAGVGIGSCMAGSKWELINELRLATRPSK